METVSTEKFWELMCDARFIRISLHEVMIENKKYYVIDPPEKVEGFMENVTLGAVGNLYGKKSRPFKFIKRIFGH